jgi:hypothetical protein
MLRALIRSTSAPGKLFSIPNRTPIFFMPHPPSRQPGSAENRTLRLNSTPVYGRPDRAKDKTE